MMTEMGAIRALPEIWLAGSGLALLLLGVFLGDRGLRLVSLLARVALLCAAVLVVYSADELGATAAFQGLFIVDGFSFFAKLLILGASIVAIWVTTPYAEREQMAQFEVPILMLFATLGMMVMVSAGDLLSLYIGLELQSLCLYVTAAIRRDALRATESGLKYFVLGALSSGILLYGVSLIYGYTGTTNFSALADIFQAQEELPLGLIFGLAFLIAGLAFKISAVPFHMWTPDVYEGAPTPITAFFAAAPKFAAVALLTRLLVGPFGPLVGEWRQIVVFMAIASMLFGSLAAINQRNIKRLMAYSSIGNIGYALVGLAAGTETGVRGLLIYMTIYIVMTIGAFAVILSMRQRGQQVEQIADLGGLSQTRPLLAHTLAIFMFSMAGIPPLAGFFGKYFVFKAAIDSGLYGLAVIGVLSSVISAFYYVRVVKVMYFDEPQTAFDRLDFPVKVVLLCTSLAILFYVVAPQPLIEGAGAAAAALFRG